MVELLDLSAKTNKESLATSPVVQGFNDNIQDERKTRLPHKGDCGEWRLSIGLDGRFLKGYIL